MTKRLYSIQFTLLFHELSFVLLVLITAAVGSIWSLSWQQSAEESLRISEMNSLTQTIRGQIYRQLKEVFDASFLNDNDALDEYQHYTQNIQANFNQLKSLDVDFQQQQAISSLHLAYQQFYHKTVIIFTSPQLNSIQRSDLDTGLEQQTFVLLEQAFATLERELSSQQQQIRSSRQSWSTRLMWLAAIPVLLAVFLLIASRRFVNINLVRPLSQVIEGAKLISKGQFDHSIAENGVTELVRLAKTINLMANELTLNRDKLIETKKQAALGELVPLVAHNIRNPLAGIRAAAQVARDDDPSDANRETLTDIMLAVDRLEKWVTSLLCYLHPVSPHFSATKLTSLADNALSLIDLQLADKNISLQRQHWLNDDEKMINVDIHLVEQVIFNLVQNAVEASKKGDIITLDYQQQDNMACLSIIDQGHGLDYDPLAESTENNQRRLNCGLGIPFALKVISQHGGQLIFAEPDHSGTTVTIKLQLINKS